MFEGISGSHGNDLFTSNINTLTMATSSRDLGNVNEDYSDVVVTRKAVTTR